MGPVLRLWLAVLILLTLTLAVAGPFGLYGEIPFRVRLGYYAPLVGLAFVCVALIWGATERLLEGWENLSADAARGLLFTIFYVPILHVIHLVLRHWQPALPRSFTDTFGRVLLIVLAILSLKRLVEAYFRHPEADTATAEPMATGPRLLERLEGHEAGRVTRLSVNDHYVSVHLQCGAVVRLLMRFADAVTEMEGEPGLCTHRSHWVALGAIARVERRGGREVVILKDGAEVPVSRSYRPGLVDLGLIG